MTSSGGRKRGSWSNLQKENKEGWTKWERGNEKRRQMKEKRRKRADWVEEMTACEGRMWEGEEKQRKGEIEGRRGGGGGKSRLGGGGRGGSTSNAKRLK